MSFLPLTSDFIFTTLFTRAPDLLAELLNATLGLTATDRLSKLTILVRQLHREQQSDKLPELDLHAQTPHGKIFNIEMQAYPQNFYIERNLYYWARIFGKRLQKGEEYGQLNAVHCISFLNFPLTNLNLVHSKFSLLETDHPTVLLSDLLQLHFVELVKFEKNIMQLENELDCWLYVIKNTAKLKGEDMEAIINHSEQTRETFMKLFEELELLSIDDSIWWEYEQRYRDELDHQNRINEVAKSKAERVELTNELAEFSNARAEFTNERAEFTNERAEFTNERAEFTNERAEFEKEMQQHEKELKQHQIELKKRQELGRERNQLDTAQKMQAEGFSTDIIQRITGLSNDELSGLLKEL